MMNKDVYFINIDAVVSNHENYNEWYYELWKESIISKQASLNINKSFEHIPDEARNNVHDENYYDPLEAQLDALKSIGFSAVECHYKCGLFAIYGGKK